jgi:hypothetical protein
MKLLEVLVTAIEFKAVLVTALEFKALSYEYEEFIEA